MQVLWREPWLKPIVDYDLDFEKCKVCEKKFIEYSFVTSCEFCDIGVMHDKCANLHIMREHKKELIKKISYHKDRPLHDFQ